MFRILLVSAASLTLLTVSLTPTPANAIVYCRTVGVPQGCVVRPVARGVGAPGVGIRRGTPMNRGGPVNRVGRR
jgi:hypothetical protein